METRANYLLVGLFVISLFVGGIGFVVWLAKVNVDASITSYEIHFEDSVSGLREGASVSYRGINVGEVKAIRIDPENLERIVVTIEVRADTPIRSDTVATLAIQGLAGGSYVLLSGGSQSAAPLVPQPGQRMAVIASKASGLQELLDSAPSVLSEANLVLKRANDLLRPENRKEFEQALINLSQLLATLKEGATGLPELMDTSRVTIEEIGRTAKTVGTTTQSFQELIAGFESESKQLASQAGATLKAFEDTARSVEGSADNLGGDLRGSLQAIRASAERFEVLGGTMNKILEENRGQLAEFTSSGLFEVVAFFSEARDLVTNVNRLLGQIERDPGNFIFGNRSEGYDAGTPD
ncbi:MlaD family protein [Limibacillus sp. MBR-115]|jgi:phospholipid/cholesterol/gamma-HCH transport system substrate-binding protein|uniref:MlaD family protein n=1 Tax=Limibacillus sp. MBR-115 TaxID=3156465 RepID=UPI0033955100